ncbi:MAG: leucine-rich repeat domain-containing protein [Eubacteriaceae bacterium]|nr:leucine-rich repeat domain-containing protein [Eubacteriaceae bacterium]
MKKFALAALCVVVAFLHLSQPVFARRQNRWGNDGYGSYNPYEYENFDEVEQLLIDPYFNLSSVDSYLLSNWYASTVEVPDSKLASELRNAMGISGTITVRNMVEDLPAELDLSNKGITSLAGMKYAINLVSLTVSYNSLTDINEIGNLYNLKYLDYSGNMVTMVPSFIFSMPQLSIANGSDNSSTGMSTSSRSNNLVELNLSGNNLVNLANVERARSLRILSLSHNKLEVLPSGISSLTDLQSLDLSFNKLDNSMNFSGLVNLENLDLEANSLESLPVGMGKLVRLQELNIASNQVKDITELAWLISLRTLVANFNQIAEIPKELTELPYLRVLDLGLNNINLSDNENNIKILQARLDTFMYKVQTPSIKLAISLDRQTSSPKLEWTGIAPLTVPGEGSYDVEFIIVERRRDHNDPTSATFFETMATLSPTATEYIDITGSEGIAYTYRVSASVKGAYIDSVEIAAMSSSLISTDQIKKNNAMSNVIKIAVVLLIASAGIFGFLFARSRGLFSFAPRAKREPVPLLKKPVFSRSRAEPVEEEYDYDDYDGYDEYEEEEDLSKQTKVFRKR